MLTLLTYAKTPDQFSLSPYCVKAAYLLVQSGQDWQRQDMTDVSDMPHQKLPVLRTPNGLVPDSDNIRRYLEGLGADFDPGLNGDQKALSRALIRMAEEHMNFHTVADRWGSDDVWPVFREIIFRDVPEPARVAVADEIRAGVVQGLHCHGIGRFSQAERLERLDVDLVAIATRLNTTAFMMRDVPTAADYSVAAVLDGMMATPVDTPQVLRIKGDKQLTDYVDRVKAAVPLP